MNTWKSIREKKGGEPLNPNRPLAKKGGDADGKSECNRPGRTK